MIRAGSLAARIGSAGGWIGAGFVYSQVLRLGGNLVLTRLLYPELFGLMAIVQAVLMGFFLLSDVGITQSIVYHSRGEETRFVNTAWTLQVIRGAVLWLLIVVFARPLAAFYGEPELVRLLPVAGLNALISGFLSTKAATADRKLSLTRVTMIDVVTSTIGLAVSVAYAYLAPSVWALVCGTLVASLLKILATQLYLDGPRNRYDWDPVAVRALLGFGRWIFLSTALTFFAGEGNRLLIGKLVDVRSLAFFSVANALGFIASQVVQTLGGRVMFPAYAEVARERKKELFRIVLVTRMLQTIPLCLIGGCLAVGGQLVIDLLYDRRYHGAGWMLELIALGTMVSSVRESYGGVFWAIGHARFSTILLAFQLAIQLIGMYFGAKYGTFGVILALAATSWILYPICAGMLAGQRLWQPILDLPVLILTAIVWTLTLPGIFRASLG